MNQEIDQKNLRRVVISSILGAVIEWYDFFLYGVVAGLFFNKLFFPDFDPFVGTLLSFATFAIGFVARPLGGVIFGHFGDKIGRKKVLILTLEIMGIATVGIGLVPTYESIGVFAPILLVICRLAQGIGLGGEWGGAVLMSFESAPAHKRGFYGSLPQIGMSLGLMLATGVIGLLSILLSDEAFLQWGWRVAFIASAVLLAIGSYMRMTIKETADFEKSKEKDDTTPEVRFPLLDAFKRYPKMIIACMGARFIDGVSFNVFGVYSLNYLTQQHGLSRDVALGAVMVSAIIMTFCIPFWGHVADRVGKAKVYGIAAVVLGLMVYPAFWVLHNYSHNIFMVTLALAIPFGILHAAVFGTMASLFSDSFDASVRYSGISFVYQFTAIFASGLTPMIATDLTHRLGGQPWLLCGYMVFIAFMSAACTYWMHSMNKNKGLAPARTNVGNLAPDKIAMPTT